MSYSQIANIIILSSSFSCFEYEVTNKYAQHIEYSEFNTKHTMLPSTLDYNVQTMEDINNYQNQKILDLLFQQEYKYLIEK